MRGKGVAQHVRMDVCRHTQLQRPSLEPGLDHAGGEASAVATDEQRQLIRPGQFDTSGRPRQNGYARHGAHRHYTGLAALAEHAQFASGHIGQTIDIQAVEFSQAQTGGIEQLKNGLIAQREEVVAGALQQGIGFVRRQCMRQGLRAFRRAYALHRVVRHIAAPAEPAIEASPGRQHARQRTAG